MTYFELYGLLESTLKHPRGVEMIHKRRMLIGLCIVAILILTRFLTISENPVQAEQPEKALFCTPVTATVCNIEAGTTLFWLSKDCCNLRRYDNSVWSKRIPGPLSSTSVHIYQNGRFQREVSLTTNSSTCVPEYPPANCPYQE